MVARRDETQEDDILEAANRILSDEGAAALTVRRIAAEAGCSTMGIYSRFGGKDGVVDALYVEGFNSLCADMTGLPETEDPVDDLRRCALRYRDYALAHATHYMVMFGGVVPDFVPSPASKTVSHDSFARLVAIVQRGVDVGAFKGDAFDIAHTLWSAMHGQVMLEQVGIFPVGGDPDARYRDLVDTVLDGLQAH